MAHKTVQNIVRWQKGTYKSEYTNNPNFVLKYRCINIYIRAGERQKRKIYSKILLKAVVSLGSKIMTNLLFSVLYFSVFQIFYKKQEILS